MTEEIKNEETTEEVKETVELMDAEKLDAGINALKGIDEELFATEIKAIETTKAALQKKEEVKSWWKEHKQDIVNGVVLVALTYVIFRVTL